MENQSENWYIALCHRTVLMSQLFQVMAWYRQATSHYLSQCWLSFLSPYGVPRPQWVKDTQARTSKYQTLACFFIFYNNSEPHAMKQILQPLCRHCQMIISFRKVSTSYSIIQYFKRYMIGAINTKSGWLKLSISPSAAEALSPILCK